MYYCYYEKMAAPWESSRQNVSNTRHIQLQSEHPDTNNIRETEKVSDYFLKLLDTWKMESPNGHPTVNIRSEVRRPNTRSRGNYTQRIVEDERWDKGG